MEVLAAASASLLTKGAGNNAVLKIMVSSSSSKPKEADPEPSHEEEIVVGGAPTNGEQQKGGQNNEAENKHLETRMANGVGSEQDRDEEMQKRDMIVDDDGQRTEDQTDVELREDSKEGTEQTAIGTANYGDESNVVDMLDNIDGGGGCGGGGESSICDGGESNSSNRRESGISFGESVGLGTEDAPLPPTTDTLASIGADGQCDVQQQDEDGGDSKMVVSEGDGSSGFTSCDGDVSSASIDGPSAISEGFGSSSGDGSNSSNSSGGSWSNGNESENRVVDPPLLAPLQKPSDIPLVLPPPVRPSLRGKLQIVGNICRGMWAMSDAAHAVPDQTSEFEFKLVKAAEGAKSFPFNGKYQGWFTLKQTPPAKPLKVEDKDMILTFTKAQDGSFSVEGRGANKYGKFMLRGTLGGEDHMLQIYREYQPKTPRPLPSPRKRPAAAVSEGKGVREGVAGASTSAGVGAGATAGGGADYDGAPPAKRAAVGSPTSARPSSVRERRPSMHVSNPSEVTTFPTRAAVPTASASSSAATSATTAHAAVPKVASKPGKAAAAAAAAGAGATAKPGSSAATAALAAASLPSLPPHSQARADANSGRAHRPPPYVPKCEALISEMWKTPGAQYFAEPVDWIKLNCPDYPTIVKHPMDLSTVRANLEKQVYDSPEAFAAHVRLIFSNALTYNTAAEHPVRLAALALSKRFEERYRAMLTALNRGPMIAEDFYEPKDRRPSASGAGASGHGRKSSSGVSHKAGKGKAAMAAAAAAAAAMGGTMHGMGQVRIPAPGAGPGRKKLAPSSTASSSASGASSLGGARLTATNISRSKSVQQLAGPNGGGAAGVPALHRSSSAMMPPGMVAGAGAGPFMAPPVVDGSAATIYEMKKQMEEMANELKNLRTKVMQTAVKSTLEQQREAAQNPLTLAEKKALVADVGKIFQSQKLYSQDVRDYILNILREGGADLSSDNVQIECLDTFYLRKMQAYVADVKGTGAPKKARNPPTAAAKPRSEKASVGRPPKKSQPNAGSYATDGNANASSSSASSSSGAYDPVMSASMAMGVDSLSHLGHLDGDDDLLFPTEDFDELRADAAANAEGDASDASDNEADAEGAGAREDEHETFL